MPSYRPPSCTIPEVASQVQHQLQQLKQVTEGDSKPEGETAAEGGEETAVLQEIERFLFLIVVTLIS